MAKKKPSKVALKAKQEEKNYTQLSQIIFCFSLFIITAMAAYGAFNDISFSGIIIEWDEARHGVNAYEMLKSGNLIVNTYKYSPDYWNVKPPLSMWQIALAYKIFGYSTFSLRFFSALYLPLIVFISMLVLKKYVGLVCSVVTGFLFAITGPRFPHLFKSGDPDALFVFMSFLACIFLYVAYKEKVYYLIGAGLCTAFAFLAKSMHVISLFAVIVIYLIFVLNKHEFTFKQLVLYLLVPMALPVAIWAALRASYDGFEFFKQIFLLDVFNRVTTVVENHTGGVLFYIQVLNNVLGGFMFLGITLLIFLGFTVDPPQKVVKKSDYAFLIIFGTMALAPFIIFTLSTTKIGWYVFPCIVGVYFIAGYSAQQLANIFIANKKYVYGFRYLSICLIFILIGGFIKPFTENINLKTTDVTSSGNLFSQTQIAPESKLFVVDAQGNSTDGMLTSWLLQAYYLGLDYVPVGMEQYDDSEDTIIVLKHTDATSLEEFRLNYPLFEDAANVTDYTGTTYTMFRQK